MKPSDLRVGVIYELKDIYSMLVDDRLAIVGGFTDNVSDTIVYVWLPSSLVKNYDENKVKQLKEKIDAGKRGFAVYKGEKLTKYNTMSYDFVWVRKN